MTMTSRCAAPPWLLAAAGVLYLAACRPLAPTVNPNGTESSSGRASPPTTRAGRTAALPDLVMDYFWQIRYTDLCPWGSPGQVVLRGRNVGTAEAGAFVVQVWEQQVEVIGVDAGAEFEIEAGFTSGPVGSIDAAADAADEILELDEENNQVWIVFTPPPECTPTGG